MPTEMALAFQRAGHPSVTEPYDRLVALGIAAWGQFPRPLAVGARQQYLRDRFMRQDGFFLLNLRRPGAAAESIDWLLQRAADIIARERPQDVGQPTVGEGQFPCDTHPPRALSNTYPRDAGQPADGRCQIFGGAQTPPAPAVPSSPDPARSQAERGSEPALTSASSISHAPARPTLTELADKHAAAGRARVAHMIELNRLDTILIDGKKIGDCTAKEVRAWAEMREADKRAAGRDARFAMSLISNLPSGAIVRDYWPKAADVETQYLKAEAENAA